MSTCIDNTLTDIDSIKHKPYLRSINITDDILIETKSIIEESIGDNFSK